MNHGAKGYVFYIRNIICHANLHLIVRYHALITERILHNLWHQLNNLYPQN